MAPRSSIYDAYLRNMAEEHEIGTGEDVSGKVCIALAESLHKVWKDQNDDHVNYDAFESNDMKDMVNILEDVVKPEAHVRMCCSALQFSFWWSFLALQKTEVQATFRKYSGYSDAKSEEKKTIDQ